MDIYIYINIRICVCTYTYNRIKRINDMSTLQFVNNNKMDEQQIIGAELFNRFISYLDASPKTIDTYKKSIRQLFNYFSFNGIKKPKREDILLYKEKLKGRGCKPTTIQNYITACKIFFKWTSQEGYYPNIAEHIKGAKLDKEHKKDYLTSSQVKDILGIIEKDNIKGLRDYAIILLMVTGGLRTIEIVRSNIEDLRALGSFTVLYVQGKGKEEKTEYIKVSSHVEKAIRTYLRVRGTMDETEPLFTSLSNNNKGKRLTTRSISEIVKDRLKKAGYNNSRLTAHSLRHTAVTLSLLAGKDLTEVQQFARHVNISTTMIYNHSLDKAKNSCSEAITKAII